MKQKIPYTTNNHLVNEHKDIPGNPSVAKSSSVSLRTEATFDSLRVLTIEQWEFWRDQGYVVIKNAVPANQVKQTADFLWEFDETRSKADPKSTWYTAQPRAEMQMKELAGTGMVEAYNHQHSLEQPSDPKGIRCLC